VIFEIIQWIQVNARILFIYCISLTRFSKLKAPRLKRKCVCRPDLKTSSVSGDMMNCNQVQAYFASRSDKKKSCIIISSFVSLFVGISVISVIILYPYPPKATSATKIFEKFGVPHNLWKTLISGQDDSTKMEEESNEKFSMNPYLKAKNYVAKHSEEKETDIRNYKWLKTEAKMKTDPGNLFRVIVN
jgi:hypothetical protein